MPIIKLSQAIGLVEIGQTVQMTATDPGSKYDVKAWARQTEHELVESRQDGKVYTYIVRRMH